jgi:chemotaxis receptor (MCP) glutamine deamidase CheD
MVLRNYAEQVQEFQFFILGTDISTRVLEKAKLGIYDEELVEPVPPDFRRKYLLKSKEKDKALVRLVPEIRSCIRFRRLNLVKNDFGLRETMDIIFCRNVIIYFNRETQEQVINRLYHHLAPGGYLFTGHSETLNGLSVPLKAVAHTVYQKEHVMDLSAQLPVITLKPAELFISERPSIVRTVLGSCVAVTMFDRRLRISAICHALLPGTDEGSELDTHTSGPYKYVNSVVPLMVQRLRNYGVEIDDLEVRLFGGADMMTARFGRPNYHPVGKSNIDAVIQAINAQSLQVNVSDVGGHMGRKILFYTHTGEVLLKRITSGTEPEWAI